VKDRRHLPLTGEPPSVAPDPGGALEPLDAGPPKWVNLGHPSYVWRSGQDRRLSLIRRYVPLERRRILDVGCGIGTYVRQFHQFSPDVYGVDVDPEKVAQASVTLPNIQVAPAEVLPFTDESFDVILLHEVVEHVDDDFRAIAEAVRVAAVGGHVVVYAPNRLYPFETHGAYFGGSFVFGLIPLVNYLPDGLRKHFCPHVRAYTKHSLLRLFHGLPVRIVVHAGIYPGFDNIAARNPLFASLLRRTLYALEHTGFQAFGLSHFLVAEKCSPAGPSSPTPDPYEAR
jgi:SAM-dependent methyltransferase